MGFDYSFRSSILVLFFGFLMIEMSTKEKTRFSNLFHATAKKMGMLLKRCLQNTMDEILAIQAYW